MKRYYLALRDSITSGYGSGNINFAVLYYSYLQAAKPYLNFVNCGIAGLTSGRLAIMISRNQYVRWLLTQAELVTITIGSNDLLDIGTKILQGASVNAGCALATMANNLELIGIQIRTLNPAAKVEAAAVYNPLAAGPFYQYARQAQGIVAQANKILRQWCEKYGFVCIPLDKAFQGRECLLLSADSIHPNIAGHKVIARAFAQWQPY